MTQRRSGSKPIREHPLVDVVQQLAAEVQVLRSALDELVSEIQWANQNRLCSECSWRHSPMTESRLDQEHPDDDPAELPSAPARSPSAPIIAATVQRRSDGRLF